MSIDILNMTQYSYDAPHAIDVAFPVLAIECAATPPIENYLDAYEETVLKFISIGLSANGIARTLNATESLVDEILTHLEGKEYVYRETGKPWKLTEAGENYLNGITEDRESENSEYGFMFVSCIKKEILPFFYSGDIGKVSLYRGEHLPLRLTMEDDENKTFSYLKVKQSKLRNAYKTYINTKKLCDDLREGGRSKKDVEEEADVLFEDLESFDEEVEEQPPIQKSDSQDAQQGLLKRKMFIRALKKNPQKMYLLMRIIIDPAYPGGYRVESPFDMYGVDDNYFQRHIQWLEQQENTFIDGEPLQEFLNREIKKLSRTFKTNQKSFSVFVLERIPLLKIYRSRFPYIYEDMERIYDLIQRENSLLEKENIVNNLARYVVEGLFNAYFRAIDKNTLGSIRLKAFDDISTYGTDEYKTRISTNVHLMTSALGWVNKNTLNTILSRISYTYGNSIMEKFINMMVVEYHLSDQRIHKFLAQTGIDDKYQKINRLNRIRRKVSHDTDNRFTKEDYKYYMANVFDIINSLLEAFREDS